MKQTKKMHDTRSNPGVMALLQQFIVREDHIETRDGKQHYLVRITPPNMGLLGATQRYAREDQLQRLLDEAGTTPGIYIMDKTQGLEEVKARWAALAESDRVSGNPQLADMTAAIRQALDTTGGDSGVERTFYLTYTLCKEEQLGLELDKVRQAFPGAQVAQKQELIQVLRNHLLREYSAFDLAPWDGQIQRTYREKMAEQEKRRRPKPVDKVLLEEDELRRMLSPGLLKFQARQVLQNDFYRRTMVVRNWPGEFLTDLVLLAVGLEQGTAMRIWLEPIDPAQQDKLLDKGMIANQEQLQSRKVSQQVKGQLADQLARESYAKSQMAGEQAYFITILMEAYANSVEDLEQKTARLKLLLRQSGMMADLLPLEQDKGYLSVLPFGQNKLEKFSRNLPTSVIAALYPFSASRKADPDGVLLGVTDKGSHLLVDLWLRDGETTNGNLTVLGAPGQGKSYAVKKLLSQLMLKGYATYTLDNENEYGDLYRALGGVNMDCAGGKAKINPLEVRQFGDRSGMEQSDPEAFRADSDLAGHLSWLRDFFPILLPGLTQAENNMLLVIVKDLYLEMGIDDRWSAAIHQPEDYPVLSDLRRYIEQAQTDQMAGHPAWQTMFSAGQLANLLLQLHEVTQGAGAACFDGHTHIPDGRHINFQLQGLIQGAGSRTTAVLFNLLTYLWGRVVIRKEKLALTVDEVYLLMSEKYRAVAEYLTTFAKRGRKYNAALVLCSQNVGDLCRRDVIDLTKPLLSLSAHRLLFYPGEADKVDLKQMMGLTDAQLAVISQSSRRNCLLLSGNSSYRLTVGTLPYEKQLFGKGGGD